MWILTTVGFFSIVQKPRQTGLTIRTRVAADLDRLRTTYLPTLSATVTGAGTDYPFRATVGREEFALALAQIARDITYANFKGEVARRQGHARERTYSKVWGVLQELESAIGEHPATQKARGITGTKQS